MLPISAICNRYPSISLLALLDLDRLRDDELTLHERLFLLPLLKERLRLFDFDLGGLSIF